MKARVAPEYPPSPIPAPPVRDEPFSGRRRSQMRDDWFAEPPEPLAGNGRRTVTITGHGAEGYASRNGISPSRSQRHRQLPRHERAGFRPDRAAMWAVLLGVILMLAAVTSAHAATLAHALH